MYDFKMGIMIQKRGLPPHAMFVKKRRQHSTFGNIMLGAERLLQLCSEMHIYAHANIWFLKINKQDLSKQKSLANTQGYQENCYQGREFFNIIFRPLELSTKMTWF
jgi:hypothetical protein